MSAYGKINIYTGNYDSIDGHIRIDGAKILYMLQLPSEHAFLEDNEQNRKSYPNAPLFLIVEDGDFWPIMIRLTVGDLARCACGEQGWDFKQGAEWFAQHIEKVNEQN